MFEVAELGHKVDKKEYEEQLPELRYGLLQAQEALKNADFPVIILVTGVDFAGKEGTEVKSVAAGVVVRSEDSGGYGNLIEVRHADGFTTRYAHNQAQLVSVGETVRKGQAIALMGSTGRSTGPHVHIEVLRNGKQVDPAKYINN